MYSALLRVLHIAENRSVGPEGVLTNFLWTIFLFMKEIKFLNKKCLSLKNVKMKKTHFHFEKLLTV